MISLNQKFARYFCTLKSVIRRPLILGIETSCDDTGAALVDRAGRVYGEVLHSQQNTHLRYGGIIPPIAQDLHRQNIERVVTETFTKSNLTANDVDAIAVTNRPGLPLSLQIGVRYAKHLARKHNKPIIPIHHMEAHALTVRMKASIEFPFLCLLASGGHCILVVVHSVDEYRRLGETLDDAPGELFDKIARQLRLRNLPEYEWLNGGQAIEMAARQSTMPARFAFPLPLARYRSCNFSFAGLKNTARRLIASSSREYMLAPDEVIPDFKDFCAGFQRAITRHICHRTQRAIEYCDAKEYFKDAHKKMLVFSGGVACNNFIFAAVSELVQQFGYEAVRPPRNHCTDNGLMIAWNGVERWLVDSKRYLELDLDNVQISSRSALGLDESDEVTNASLSCKWAKLSVMKI